MADDKAFSLEGHCTCGAVRYRMTSKPMFVHCCHCTWCQRETGASFALNAMIEADRVILLKGEPEVVNTPSNSGKGQKIARRPTSISSPRRSSPGSCFLWIRPRSRSTTSATGTGRRKASSAAAIYWRARAADETCGADSHEHHQRPLSLWGDRVLIRGRAELDAPLPLRQLPARHVLAHGHLDLGAAERVPFHRGEAHILCLVSRRATGVLRALRLSADLRERARAG